MHLKFNNSMAPAARLNNMKLYHGRNFRLNVCPDSQESSLSFPENINGQWGALETSASRHRTLNTALIGLQRKAFK